MARAMRSAYLETTAEDLWSFLEAPQNITEWWPNCVQIYDVKRSEDGRLAFKWVDRCGELALRGEVEEVVEQAGKRLAVHITGDIHGDMAWRLEPQNGGVKLDFESDYDLPVRSLIPFLSPVRLLTYQQDEADAIVARMRERYNGQLPISV